MLILCPCYLAEPSHSGSECKESLTVMRTFSGSVAWTVGVSMLEGGSKDKQTTLEPVPELSLSLAPIRDKLVHQKALRKFERRLCSMSTFLFHIYYRQSFLGQNCVSLFCFLM